MALGHLDTQRVLHVVQTPACALNNVFSSQTLKWNPPHTPLGTIPLRAALVRSMLTMPQLQYRSGAEGFQAASKSTSWVDREIKNILGL